MKDIRIKIYPAQNPNNVYLTLSGIGKYGKRIERFAEISKRKLIKERVNMQ